MENISVNQFEVVALTDVVELSANELQDIEGGIIPLVIGGLALFDACLWGYILTH